METSDSYLVLERMIRAGEILPSELEHLLSSLAGQELITPAEHTALLELAQKISKAHPAIEP